MSGVPPLGNPVAAASTPEPLTLSPAAVAPAGVPVPSAAAWTPSADDERLFRLASATRLNTPFTRGLYARYVKRFGEIVQQEVAAFGALELPANEKTALSLRVTTAIRRTASFAAWYDIVGHLFRLGYGAALFAGYVAVLAFGARLYLGVHDIVFTAVPVAAGVVCVALGDRITRMLSRRWPLDAIACIVALGIVTIVLRQQNLVFWLPASWSAFGPIFVQTLIACAWGIASFNAVLLVLLVAIHRLYSWVNAAKLDLYPEDEIIESLTAVLGKLATAKGAWVSGRVRVAIVDDLEWIAVRFERDFLGRFCRGDTVTNTWMRETGARLAAACRLRERLVAFPQTGGMDRVSSYALSTLLHAASGDWNAIEQSDAAEPEAPKRWSDHLGDVGKIAFPALTGFVVFFVPIPGLSNDIKQNVLFTGVVASVVGLWGLLDPQHADKGLSAAQTLGDILRPGAKIH
ncbi:MAG TPA: hypothetical protein VGX96_14125 [Candidatus Elarobacter sp.]|nr:hypothetical protein [Candidatus Elarobacter sp.]